MGLAVSFSLHTSAHFAPYAGTALPPFLPQDSGQRASLWALSQLSSLPFPLPHLLLLQLASLYDGFNHPSPPWNKELLRAQTVPTDHWTQLTGTSQLLRKCWPNKWRDAYRSGTEGQKRQNLRKWQERLFAFSHGVELLGSTISFLTLKYWYIK